MFTCCNCVLIRIFLDLKQKMSIEVIFGHFIGSGENRIIVTRQDRRWTGRGRQTEPVVGGAKGHHLVPLKKLEVLGENRDRVIWSYQPKATSRLCSGPFSDLKTRQIFYICGGDDGDYGFHNSCLVACPCLKCRCEVFEDTNENLSIDGLNDHLMYHHVPHVGCAYCSELLKSLPAYTYERKTSIGPFYDPKYKMTKTYRFAHSYQIDHDGTKFMKYECEICGNIFKKVSHKKRHYLKCHYEAKFICEVCKKSFSRKDVLARHMSTVHSEDKFVCASCESKFSSKSNLMRHYEKFHVNNQTPQNACDICGG